MKINFAICLCVMANALPLISAVGGPGGGAGSNNFQRTVRCAQAKRDNGKLEIAKKIFTSWVKKGISLF